MTRAQLIADSLVSISAIGGLAVVTSVLRRGGSTDIATRRVRFGLWLVMILLGARVLSWLTGIGLFSAAMFIAAALMPLATIMIAEGLLRRHAGPTVKYASLAATIVLLVLALCPESLVEPGRSWFLCAAQLAGFALAGWMLLRRDRASLTASENWLVDRMILPLVLILPLLLTDFRFDGFDLPVRLGGIAILFTCWIVVGMGRGHFSQGETIRAFLVLAASACAAGIGVAVMEGLSLTGGVQTVAVIFAACLLAAIFSDSQHLAAAERQRSLLAHIAGHGTMDAAGFLAMLRRIWLVEDALTLEAADLKDFDGQALAALFERDPVRRAGDFRATWAAGSPEEQMAALFERYGATHILMADRQPLTLLALKIPGMVSGRAIETELRAMQRVAMLLSERHDGHHS